MDYGTLAQLSNPGQNPIAGPGIVDIEAYSNYRNLANMRQESLRNAMPLAALDAQKQQQAAKEYMMGAPAREQAASDSLGTYERDKFTKDLEHMAKDAELRNKILDATENLGPDADAYFNGDDKVKQAIIERNRGKRLGNGYVVGTDPNKDDQIFTARGAMRAYNPALANKERVQGMKNEGALNVVNAKGQWSNLTSAQRNQAMIEMKKLQGAIDAARQANKPLTAEQGMFESIKRLANGDDATIYALMSQYKAASAQAKLENEAEFLRQYNIKGPAQAPAHAPITPGGGAVTKPETKNTTNDVKPDDIKIGSPWGVGKDASGKPIYKTVKRIGRIDGKVVKLELEDGTIVDYK